MMRPTFHVTAIFNCNPDDVVDLTQADIASGVQARLDEFFATEGAWCVRPVGVDVLVEPVEIDAEPDGYTALINHLVSLRSFHDDDDPEQVGFDPAAALTEAIDLLRTHALPPEHPLAEK